MSSSKNLEFEKSGFLSKSNSAFIEQMYLQYLNNDPNLPKSWKEYFNEIGDEADIIVKEINGPSWNPKKNKASLKIFFTDCTSIAVRKQIQHVKDLLAV